MNRFILLYLLSTLIYAKNIGHRLGGDIYTPENTLFSYKKLQKHMNKVIFVEFDVRETKDHELIVFHDSRINRLVPETNNNQKIVKHKNFKDIEIKNLTLEQISKLLLENNASIPTLQDVLDASVEWNIQKPIRIDIKSLDSDIARHKIIQIVSKYTKKLNISFIVFSKNFSNSFPYPERWLSLLVKNNLNIYQIDLYNLTKAYLKYTNTLEYTTLLKEVPFSIQNNNQRKVMYPVSVPKGINNLLVGVYHGADDSGDRGISIKLINDKNKTLLSSFSNKKKWEWFSIQKVKDSNCKLILEDRDTQVTGKYPGNKGKVKILGVYKL